MTHHIIQALGQALEQMPHHTKHVLLDVLVIGSGFGASVISIMGIVNPILTAMVLAATLIITILRIIAWFGDSDDE
jgi:hypothetical protein